MHLTKPSALRFTLGAAALVLAVIAQILIGQGDLRWAVAPLLLAAGAIGLATAKMPLPPWAARHVESERPSECADGGRVDVHRRKLIAWRGDLEQLLGLVAFALSLIALIAALRRFPLDPPYTLAWVFFGASVLLLLLALPTVEAGWTRLAGRLRERPPITFGLSALVPWAALAFILILALAVRLYHLQELPAGLWYDEADNLAQALRIQTDPGATPVYVPSTNLPSLFLMPIAVVIELAGLTIATGRLVSVAFGVAGVVAIFLLVRLMLGPHLALVASLLIAVMRWDINWSRIGMHGITAPFFTALVAYLTLRAVRSGR